MSTRKTKSATRKGRVCNLEEAERFLALLDPDPSAQFTFQTFNEADGGSASPQILHGTLDQHAQALQGVNQAGSGVFVMVNRGNGQGRSAKDVAAVRAVFVDLDGAPLEPVLDGPIKPGIVVSTSPQRWHCYWPVTDLPLHEFKAVQTALAEQFNGDKSVSDLPRVMRLPGFYHLKAEPFLAHLLKTNEIK